MKTRIATLAVIAGLAFAPAAIASEKFEIEFDFSPVEVATEEGAEKTYADLKSMIEKECEPLFGARRVIERIETRQCVSDTLDKAVAEIDAPEVTRIHEASRG